jgi:peptide-methionine (R)-S-oxide reductase
MHQTSTICRAALIFLGWAAALLIVPIASGCRGAAAQSAHEENSMANRVDATGTPLPASEAQWQAKLTPQQFHVLRNKGTERAFTGEYWDHKEQGTYRCAGCGKQLFESDEKFDSGCGWPSFTAPADESVVAEQDDFSNFMHRTEVLCSNCGGHLGHVFPDGPGPTGLRYCINSASLKFEKKDGAGAE